MITASNQLSARRTPPAAPASESRGTTSAPRRIVTCIVDAADAHDMPALPANARDDLVETLAQWFGRQPTAVRRAMARWAARVPDANGTAGATGPGGGLSPRQRDV